MDKKKKTLIIGIIVSIIVLVVLGIILYNNHQKKNQDEERFKTPDVEAKIETNDDGTPASMVAIEMTKEEVAEEITTYYLYGTNKAEFKEEDKQGNWIFKATSGESFMYNTFDGEITRIK